MRFTFRRVDIGDKDLPWMKYMLHVDGRRVKGWEIYHHNEDEYGAFFGEGVEKTDVIIGLITAKKLVVEAYLDKHGMLKS